jgi:hypothetical protein
MIYIWVLLEFQIQVSLEFFRLSRQVLERNLSSRILRRAVWWFVTNFTEEPASPVLGVDNFWTPKMGAAFSSETFLASYQPMFSHIQKRSSDHRSLRKISLLPSFNLVWIKTSDSLEVHDTRTRVRRRTEWLLSLGSRSDVCGATAILAARSTRRKTCVSYQWTVLRNQMCYSVSSWMQEWVAVGK